MKQSAGLPTLTVITFLFIAVNPLRAQITPGQLGGGNLNTITTAVPFLLISPDARAGAMGEVGAATQPDVNSIHWNGAKLAFAEDNLGIGINYNPWLRNLVPDISLSYVSFYKRLDKMQTIGGSLRYFSLGDITFTDITGQQIATFKPNEFAVDGVYSRRLGDKFSMGIGLRYIYSNLAAGLDQNQQTIPGKSFAGDLSAYYRTPATVMGKDGEIAFGASITNLGAKIAYSESGNTNFLPTNLRLGTTATAQIDAFNRLSVSLDLNKLLVPTNPIYARDSSGRLIPDPQGGYVIEKGEDPNKKSVLEGVFSSFGDAPDGGLEELREINVSLGLEYWYNNVFSVRGGYFYEHPTKGGRQFATLGAGLRYQVFQINFAYLVPTTRLQGGHPLENTLRFGLNFDLAAFAAGSE